MEIVEVTTIEVPIRVWTTLLVVVGLVIVGAWDRYKREQEKKLQDLERRILEEKIANGAEILFDTRKTLVKLREDVEQQGRLLAGLYTEPKTTREEPHE